MYNGARVKVVKPRVGYTDLKDEPEDGRRYEIYDGEVFVVPSPALPHQTAAHRRETRCHVAGSLRSDC